MQGIGGVGAAGSGNVQPNLKTGASDNSANPITPQRGNTTDIQATSTTVSSSKISMASTSTEFGEFLNTVAVSPQQSQMMQALVALMILIAMLEQLQQGGESGNNMLEALSSGLGSGGSVAGSYFASSSVAYEQTTVAMTQSASSQGGAGAAGEQSGGESQIDITA